jgi:hypothetical protein
MAIMMLFGEASYQEAVENALKVSLFQSQTLRA